GREDVYVANDNDPDLLLRNRGGGVFSDTATEAGVAYGADGVATSSMGIGLGDYDASGRESLFITNLHGEAYSLFHNDGRGLFSYATAQAGLRAPTINRSGWGVAFLDFDRDGWPDLVTANGDIHPYLADELPGVSYAEPKGVFRNQGHGDFADISEQAGAIAAPRVARGLAVGDYDNDGRPDVLCVNANARADLFRNVSRDANHW